MTEIQLRATMCEIGRRLWQRGLIGASEGNLSARLSPRQLLCTPSGLSKGHLRPDDMVVIDLKGEPQRGGTPSSEIKLHLKIYELRKDCSAVVHAHPPIATGFALAGEEIPDALMPEAVVVLGSVATVPFCMPGTDELPNAISPLVEDHKTFLLSHHGAVTMGSNLEDACFRMETLERVAHSYLIAKMLKGPQEIKHGGYDALVANSLHGRLN